MANTKSIDIIIGELWGDWAVLIAVQEFTWNILEMKRNTKKLKVISNKS